MCGGFGSHLLEPTGGCGRAAWAQCSGIPQGWGHTWTGMGHLCTESQCDFSWKGILRLNLSANPALPLSPLSHVPKMPH